MGVRISVLEDVSVELRGGTFELRGGFDYFFNHEEKEDRIALLKMAVKGKKFTVSQTDNVSGCLDNFSLAKVRQEISKENIAEGFKSKKSKRNRATVSKQEEVAERPEEVIEVEEETPVVVEEAEDNVESNI